MNEHTSIFEIMNQLNSSDILTDLAQIEVIDTTIVNEVGQTPLHLAVVRNQIEVAALLLSKGFNPNQKDKTMLSPFIAAAANGLSDMFHLLLQFSPDLTQYNRFGGTALLPSSEKGFIRVVQPALDAGVPVNHINRLGWTALLEAVILGDDGFLFRDIVEELIAAGADITIKDFDGKDALAYAKENNASLIVDILENGVMTTPFSTIKELIRANKFYESIQKLLIMEETTEQIYYLGFTYESLGRLDAARYYYQKGLEEDSQFAYYLANLYKKMGNKKEAIAYFEKGEAESKKTSFFKYHKSNYLREIGEHLEAITVMDDLLRVKPKRVDYMFHKANSLRSVGQFHSAYNVLTQADSYQPKNRLFSEQAEQLKNEFVKNGG
uniref:ankyrin repeat domain-containing protein n=1 Tax=Candidatus Enterococcus willemsii TaxID=1857215 RepID=UPI00403FC17D